MVPLPVHEPPIAQQRAVVLFQLEPSRSTVAHDAFKCDGAVTGTHHETASEPHEAAISGQASKPSAVPIARADRCNSGS